MGPQTVINYKLLERHKDVDAETAVTFCSKPGFVDLLKSEKKKDWIDLMLCVIERGLTVDNTLQAFRDQLVKSILVEQSTFLLETSYERLENDLENDPDKVDAGKLALSLKSYLHIYLSLLLWEPKTITLMYGKIKHLQMLIKEKLPDFPELDIVSAEYDDVRTKTDVIKKKESQIAEITTGSGVIQRGDRIFTTHRPMVDFRSIPVHPTIDDVLLDQPVVLRKNKVAGGYEDVLDYLDVQFRLFREDFVATIREGIKAVRANPVRARYGKLRSGDCKVYNGFHIKRIKFTRDGIHHVLAVNRSSHIFKTRRWLSTKRLQHGSLVCLSNDEFKSNILIATITNRPRLFFGRHNRNMKHEDHDDFAIDISFLPESKETFHSMGDQTKGPYMVVESSALFVSYHHVLIGLQAMGRDYQRIQQSFPFQCYIIRCEPESCLPAYIGANIHYRLPLPGLEWRPKVSDLVPLHNTEKWPQAEELGLNDSQYAAYKAALTQEFTVIQGPPGTGKTYVGLKLVKTLLRNLYPCNNSKRSREKLFTVYDMEESEVMDERTPNLMENPILLVCYTNHALDQFLEGILEFCDTQDVVRVGSRSKSEKIIPLNINNRMKGFESSVHWTIQRDTNSEKKRLERTYADLMKYTTTRDTDGVKGLDSFFPGVIHREFKDQLCGRIYRKRSDYHREDVMDYWLKQDTGSHSKEVDASGSKEKHNQYTRKDTSSTVANDDDIFKYEEEYDPDKHLLEGVDDSLGGWYSAANKNWLGGDNF